MACILSTGIAKGCKTGIGGTKRFLLTNKSNVLTYTEGTEGYLTGITLSAGTHFYEFVTSKFSSSWSDNPLPVANNSGTAYQPTVTMNFAKNESTKRNAVKLLGQAELVCIVQNADGTYWYLGATNGLELAAGGAYTSGVAITDANQWTIVLQGGEPEPAFQIDSAIITALL